TQGGRERSHRRIDPHKVFAFSGAELLSTECAHHVVAGAEAVVAVGLYDFSDTDRPDHVSDLNGRDISPGRVEPPSQPGINREIQYLYEKLAPPGRPHRPFAVPEVGRHQ